MRSVPLTVHKLHGLGNEFLVSLPDESALAVGADWSAVAPRVCSPATGPGADGLIVSSWNDDELVMLLLNADGTRAEMSGNGIRCLVHAVHRELSARGRARSSYRVLTDAGLRTVSVLSVDGDLLVSSVDMGRADEIGPPAEWSTLGCHPDRPVAHLSLGNPHAVVGVDDVGEVDLAGLGAKVPQVNLEVVSPGQEPGTIRMRVHERGVGVTAACGTGACAAAVAALRWGLVPASVEEITVRMDGGDVKVVVSDSGAVTLIGPSEYLGVHEVEP